MLKFKKTKPDAPQPENKFLEEYDAFIGSHQVISLTAKSFQDFLTSKDAVLVLFYSPLLPNADFVKDNFRKAAESTNRENHAYAAVNCTVEKSICDQQIVSQIPFFRMYTRGFIVGSIREPKTFNADIMRSFVENVPVSADAKAEQRTNCLLNPRVKALRLE